MPIRKTKYVVKDEDGSVHTVEKEEEIVENGNTPDDVDAQKDKKDAEAKDSELTPEDIASLKSLAAVAKDLVALVQKPAEDGCGANGQESATDADEDDKKDPEGAAHDSFKKGAGANEKHADDSYVDDSLTKDAEVKKAWAKRGGSN